MTHHPGLSIRSAEAKGDGDGKVSTGEKSDGSEKFSTGEKSDGSDKTSNKKRDDSEEKSFDKKGDDGSKGNSNGEKSNEGSKGEKSEDGAKGEKDDKGSAPTTTPTAPTGAPTTPTGGSTGGSTGVKSDGSEKVFSVLDFGAKADGKTDNAVVMYYHQYLSLMRAACDSGAKARMVIPEGEFVVAQMDFTGPCKAPVVVEVAGTLKAKPDPKSYSEDTWMLFQSVTGVLLTGAGVVDGQGPLVWKFNSRG